jgi:hypothetical protein
LTIRSCDNFAAGFQYFFGGELQLHEGDHVARKVRVAVLRCDYGLVCHPVFFLLFFKTFRVAVLLKKLPARIDGQHCVTRKRRYENFPTHRSISFSYPRFPDHRSTKDNLLKIIVGEMAGGYFISDLRRRYQSIWRKEKKQNFDSWLSASWPTLATYVRTGAALTYTQRLRT